MFVYGYRINDSMCFILVQLTGVFLPNHKFCCSYLLLVFGVRVSVIFHLTCLHTIFSSVWVAE